MGVDEAKYVLERRINQNIDTIVERDVKTSALRETGKLATILSALNGNQGGSSSGGSTTTTVSITATGVTVGGISDGDTVPSGTSLDGFIQMLIQKKISPTYTKPSVTISKSPNISIFERGVSTVINMTPTFTQNDAGSATSYAWSNGIVNTSPSAVSYSITDTTTATVTVSYSEGATKNDNFGNPDTTGKITAGSVQAKTTITAVDPIYYGVGIFNINSKNGTKEVINKPSTKKCSFTTSNDSVFIASPYTISKITDPSGFDNTGSFTQSTDTYTRADGTTVTYYIYTSGLATVTDFEYTFTFS